MTSSDPRPMLFRASDQAARVVRGVSAAQLGLPTPCTDFDVSALLTHIVGVENRVAAVGRGEAQTGPVPVSDEARQGRWADGFDEAHRQTLAAWADDEVLDRKVELPFGTFDGATEARIYTMELTAHAWDLAQATGQVALLDDELAEASLAFAPEVLPPAPRGGFIPFAPVVAVPADASAYDRLAAYLGRGVI